MVTQVTDKALSTTVAKEQPGRVVVAGGGIAGITAALKLARAGYQVTLYEAKPWLGGNLASMQKDLETGPYHDVYPHMFSNFYVNFWDLVENELGLRRSWDGVRGEFEPRQSMKFLSLGKGFSEVRAASDPVNLWKDMMSGVGGASPLDTFLYLYSMLDLITYAFEGRGSLELSLNGFVRSRPCVTPAVAKMHDTIVMFIWSIHSAATSANSYANFNRHTFGNVEPLLWLLRGSLQETVIEPLHQRLKALGCVVETNKAVRGVGIVDGRVNSIILNSTTYDPKRHAVVFGPREQEVQYMHFDHLVLAVPPNALGEIADAAPPKTRKLSSVFPQLRNAGKRLASEPIAVLDLYFKRKLPNIPPENIAVTDSDCYFSIIDISQLWDDKLYDEVTALTLAASDYWALPSRGDDKANAFALVRELHARIGGFKTGAHWGDDDSDIDWSRTFYRNNKDDVIFVNQVGNSPYRPPPHPAGVENLYFAGDFCRNHVDMATVEAAVSSGINAAMALQQRHPLGTPIRLKTPPIVPMPLMVGMKMMLAPYAYAAKTFLMAADAASGLASGDDPAESLHDMVRMAAMPMRYTVDMIETVGTLAERLTRKALPRRHHDWDVQEIPRMM